MCVGAADVPATGVVVALLLSAVSLVGRIRKQQPTIYCSCEEHDTNPRLYAVNESDDYNHVANT